jgi:hypothetical protein
MSPVKISEKRILAARANGAKSRGPATPEGKARSSHNATRHGLLSSQVVLEHEDPEAFQSLLQGYIGRLQPRDQIEMNLVEAMVAAQWRLNRAVGIETRLLETAMAACDPGAGPGCLDPAFDDLARTPTLSCLIRYQGHLQRVHAGALRTLLALRRGFPQNSVLPNEPNESLVFNKTAPATPPPPSSGTPIPTAAKPQSPPAALPPRVAGKLDPLPFAEKRPIQPSPCIQDTNPPTSTTAACGPRTSEKYPIDSQSQFAI